ncbi:10564_t:CDS:2 [Paraglomus occultum]|uniref:10564_t:CDS:1 n=1 Tax=Paraglomus occultum TaxID=144539 RepID=A0A9N9F233_9GLOM|nr:10564_t:CDS:2 [Paraglomus occultum]
MSPQQTESQVNKTVPDEMPSATPILIGRLLSERKFIVDEQAQVKHLDASTIPASSTVYLRNCENGEYFLDSVCTKVMIGELLTIKKISGESIEANAAHGSDSFQFAQRELAFIRHSLIVISKFPENCKNLIIVANDKIITSTIDIWKSSNVSFKLNTQVQTVQVDECGTIDIEYDRPSAFHSVVWTATSELKLRILESGEEKYSLTTGENIPIQSETSESIEKVNPYQYIIRLINGSLKSEELIRAEKGFPITQRELEHWRAVNNIST